MIERFLADGGHSPRNNGAFTAHKQRVGSCFDDSIAATTGIKYGVALSYRD